MIAITGKNGYIASSLKKYFDENDIEARCVSVRSEPDENLFDNTDVVIHAAGIVHNKKADPALYENVNVKLTEKLAALAKKNGVKHFIFFSTMSVYGLTTGEINGDTPLLPKNDYGKSKLAAEKILFDMADGNFKVTVIRPPMVYGKNCPGNYRSLSKLVKTVKIIPDTENKRSMIYISNLLGCVGNIVKNGTEGIILPQNKEYVNTADMCGYIAKYNGKKILFSKKIGKIVSRLNINAAKKAFGRLYYSKDIAFLCNDVTFEDSIKFTEK